MVVRAATNRIDCRSPINGGVQLWAEGLLSGARRFSAAAEFIIWSRLTRPVTHKRSDAFPTDLDYPFSVAPPST